LINPEFIKHLLENMFRKKQSESHFLKGTKQSSLKMMGCKKKFVELQEEVALFLLGPLSLYSIPDYFCTAASSCTSIPSCATPIYFLYSKNTLY